MRALACGLGLAIFLNNLLAFGGLGFRCSPDRLQNFPKDLSCKGAGPKLSACDRSWLLQMWAPCDARS